MKKVVFFISLGVGVAAAGYAIFARRPSAGLPPLDVPESAPLEEYAEFNLVPHLANWPVAATVH